MNFLAVTYFGQIVMLWYLALATIGSMSVAQSPATAARRWVVRVRTVPVRRPQPVPAALGPTGSFA